MQELPDHTHAAHLLPRQPVAQHDHLSPSLCHTRSLFSFCYDRRTDADKSLSRLFKDLANTIEVTRVVKVLAKFSIVQIFIVFIFTYRTLKQNIRKLVLYESSRYIWYWLLVCVTRFRKPSILFVKIAFDVYLISSIIEPCASLALFVHDHATPTTNKKSRCKVVFMHMCMVFQFTMHEPEINLGGSIRNECHSSSYKIEVRHRELLLQCLRSQKVSQH